MVPRHTGSIRLKLKLALAVTAITPVVALTADREADGVAAKPLGPRNGTESFAVATLFVPVDGSAHAVVCDWLAQ